MAAGGRKGPTKGDTVFACVYVRKYFTNLLLRNHWTRKADIYMKAFQQSAKASLLKSWLPLIRWFYNREHVFT
jgi:hypothetical protein